MIRHVGNLFFDIVRLVGENLSGWLALSWHQRSLLDDRLLSLLRRSHCDLSSFLVLLGHGIANALKTQIIICVFLLKPVRTIIFVFIFRCLLLLGILVKGCGGWSRVVSLVGELLLSLLHHDFWRDHVRVNVILDRARAHIPLNYACRLLSLDVLHDDLVELLYLLSAGALHLELLLGRQIRLHEHRGSNRCLHLLQVAGAGTSERGHVGLSLLLSSGVEVIHLPVVVDVGCDHGLRDHFVHKVFLLLLYGCSSEFIW